ncbi:hypothetical protein G6F43_000252 [Rhizopus delemar]|nr:hypothetical protein G6F43_000252 [Rhizopus delemar]
MRLFTVASTALTFISVAQAFDHFPFPCRQTYTAVDGDTCQSIASNQDISAEDLTKWTLKFEDNFSCDEIKAGNLVCIDYSDSFAKRAVHAKQSAHHKKATHKKATHKKATHKKATHKKVAHKKDKHAAKSSHHDEKRSAKKAVEHKKKAAHHKKATHHKKSAHHKKAAHAKKAPHAKKTTHIKKLSHA